MSDKILKKVLRNFRHSIDSDQYNTWRKQAAEDQDFYDGKQWTVEEIASLRERGQPDITINEIAPKVDSIINQELQNKTKTVYKSRSFDPAFKELAEAMTTLALNVQENADTQYEQSDVFTDQLKTGIGWMELDVKEGFITTDRVDPFLMVWDIDDHSRQLTDSMFVSRMKWYDVDEAKNMFPKKSKELEKLVDSAKNDDGQYGLQTISNHAPKTYNFDGTERQPFSFVDTKQDKILIVEQQYKKSAVKYRYLNEEGQQKETFDEDMANKMKAPESEVEQIRTFEIWRAFFTEDILFENIPHPVQIGEFTLIPTIHKRDEKKGVPYGIITNSKDAQREVNKRRSKMMHLLNTRGVIADAGAVENSERARQEISRPDFWLEVKQGKTIDIQDNLSLADSQARVMFQAKEDISTTMGVFNENIGQPTNATSGIGIQRRQAASVGTKGFAFESFDRFKKRFGRLLGVMMQTVFSEKTYLSVFKDDESGSAIILNRPYEKNGKQYFENDISTLFFDVHVSQMPNFEAAPEVLAETLQNVVMNGQIGILLQSPTFAKAMGFQYIDQVLEELQSQQQQAAPSPEQAQDGASPNPNA